MGNQCQTSMSSLLPKAKRLRPTVLFRATLTALLFCSSVAGACPRMPRPSLVRIWSYYTPATAPSLLLQRIHFIRVQLPYYTSNAVRCRSSSTSLLTRSRNLFTRLLSLVHSIFAHHPVADRLPPRLTRLHYVTKGSLTAAGPHSAFAVHRPF